jgi:hypothetical protein
MDLQDWIRNSWIVAHQPTTDEIRLLLRTADRDLSDCRVLSVSEDNRFAMAHQATVQVAEAALCAEGFRTSKGARQSFQSTPLA